MQPGRYDAVMQLAEYLKQCPRGEAARISREIKVPASHISEYVRGERKVPARKAIALERATFGRVHRCDVRDDWRDLWPDFIPQGREQGQA